MSLPAVKAWPLVRRRDDSLQRLCKLRLLEYIALLPALAVVLIDAFRIRIICETSVVAHRARSAEVQRETVARETNRRRHHLLQSELAEVFLRILHAFDGTRHANRFVADAAQSRNDVAFSS